MGFRTLFNDIDIAFSDLVYLYNFFMVLFYFHGKRREYFDYLTYIHYNYNKN